MACGMRKEAGSGQKSKFHSHSGMFVKMAPTDSSKSHPFNQAEKWQTKSEYLRLVVHIYIYITLTVGVLKTYHQSLCRALGGALKESVEAYPCDMNAEMDPGFVNVCAYIYIYHVYIYANIIHMLYSYMLPDTLWHVSNLSAPL